MESLSLSLLLLSLVPLVPLVGGAELQDSEIQEQVDLVKVEQTQSSPSDLQSNLRDLSVKLAMLQTKVETLQKENSDQALKLDRNQAVIQELRIINVEQSSKLKDFITQVDSQQQELKNRMNETEKEVRFLRKDREDGRVAFSTSLLASGYADTGPYDVDTTLIFRHVFTNIGEAYNHHTGIFTAPLRGLYSFDFYFNGYAPTSAYVKLMKNAEHIISAFEYELTGHGTAGNTVSLELEHGDVVYIRLPSGRRIYDDQNHYCTFSGRLLFLL